MKKWLSILLALAMVLALAACTQGQPPAEEEPEQPEEPAGPAYWFEKETTADKFSDDEGNLLASYSYEIMVMRVSDTADEATTKMAEAFNRGMQEVLDRHLETGSELGQWAAYDEAMRQRGGYYTDELEAEGCQMGNIYTVRFSYYSDTGGAHPNQSYVTNIFDLERGEYIDPLEIADDPELFRATVTDLILDQIQHLDEETIANYFSDYESAVAQWNTRYTSFGEDGITVIFSTYDLGPFAMGAQEFNIDYSDVSSALGEGGQAKLGLVTPEAAQ